MSSSFLERSVALCGFTIKNDCCQERPAARGRSWNRASAPPHHVILTMAKTLSYLEAIRIAEEREASVKAIFSKYDLDKSESIDMDELLVLLDDLGLLTKLKTEPTDFAAEMFTKYDANSDGVLRWVRTKRPPRVLDGTRVR